MKIIRKEDTVTTEWSGGTTTQLAIFPDDAVYADRDFLWRLSTAEVLDEKSTFTKLPDYKRFLTIRKGELRIKHDDGEWYMMKPSDVTKFDGASQTLSEGRVTDFNLMLRKDRTDGQLMTATLEKGKTAALNELFPDLMPDNEDLTTAIYVSAGGPVILHMTEGADALNLDTGEMILLDEADKADKDGNAAEVMLSAEADSALFCTQMKING